MNKIKFVPSHYWNKETMTLESANTAEQWQQVKDVCNNLNTKYATEQGCRMHPDRQQVIQLGLFNKFVDIQIQRDDTCCCHDIVEKLINIRNIELLLLNPEYFKERQG
jgi:hypothetical protein